MTIPCCNRGCGNQAPGVRQPWCSPACRRKTAESVQRGNEQPSPAPSFLVQQTEQHLKAVRGQVTYFDVGYFREQMQAISGYYAHPPAGITIPPQIREMLDQQTNRMRVPAPSPALTYDDVIAFYRSLPRGFVPAVLQDSIPLAEQLRRAATQIAQEPPGNPVLVVNATTADAITQAETRAGRPLITPTTEVVVSESSVRRRWWHRFTKRTRPRSN